MRARERFMIMAVLAGCALAEGVSPGRELWLPAAARVGGWVTDVAVLNLGDAPARVELTWIERDVDSRAAGPLLRTVAAGESLYLDDVVLGLFGRAEAAGAIRIAADQELVVTSRIWNSGGGPGTRGQGFEAVPVSAAVTSGGETHLLGLTQNRDFRSNLFAVNPGDEPARLRFELLDPSGAVVATSSELTLPPWSALYRSVPDLGGPDLEAGTVRARVLAGAAIVVGSKVDNLSLDPTTLEAWWRDSGAGAVGGAWHGTVSDPGGFLGGIVLILSVNGELRSVDLTFPSTLCHTNFAAGRAFDPAPSLGELADGVEVEERYEGGGTMRFTLRLSPTGDAFSGVVEAEGSGFSGSLVGCNGSHPADTVRLGRLPS